MQDLQLQESEYPHRYLHLYSEIVIMHNLRLPALDKNRIIDQQMALVFHQETCKYDVILCADFLTKICIDVKYSTGTMGWFNNQLQLHNKGV